MTTGIEIDVSSDGVQPAQAVSVALRVPAPNSGAPSLTRGDRLGPFADHLVRPRRPDHLGRITVLRGPAPHHPPPIPLAVAIELPPNPGEPPALAWIGAISSLIGGAVVAFIFSPLFAILAAVSAVTLFGRSVAGRVSNRRAHRRRAAAIADARCSVATAMDDWCLGEAERRSALRRPGLQAELAGGAMPWQGRLTNDVPLPLSIGVGSVDVAGPEHSISDPVVGGFVPQRCTLEHVPLTIELGPAQGLALIGAREDSLGVARSAVVNALASFGPSELTISVVTTADRLVDWDWLKWMPSMVGVAIDHVTADRLLDLGQTSAEPASSGGPLRLIVIDGVEPIGPGALARVVSGRSPSARPLWIGDRIDVPAACVSIADIAADESVTVEQVRSLGSAGVEGTSMVGQVDLLGLVAAHEIARCLAPFDDPLVIDAGGRLPNSLSLGDVLADDHEVTASWRRADRSRLIAPLGRDLDGIVQIDLVSDGPHVLIAGTTGSGKSELARTIVLSAALHQPPELASFVLVDFKGGGAFDVVADLPHVSAVVTDLDAASASRALRALRAELRSREERLREMEVGDILDAHLGPEDEPLPRLVIVVDEFAALADELPDFLDGLVDVARRGRSLGVHLVLATQRPAGVVTGQIRANTNLRICLRVQDRTDSMDVIDRADAALLPAVPGRAVIDRGGRTGELQVAHVSGTGRADDVTPFVIHPALLDNDSALAIKYGRAASDYRHSMLASMAGSSVAGSSATVGVPQRIEACRAAAHWVPAPPWLDPLAEIDLAAVPVDCSRTQVPLGMIDDPDHRTRLPLLWAPSETGLLVVGADPGETERSVTVGLAGLLNIQPQTHVYVFDGNGGLAGLETVEGVGAVVSSNDGARAIKLLHRLRQVSAGRTSIDSAGCDPVCIVVHRWSAVAEGLEAEAGLDARAALERLVRDAVDHRIAVIVTGVDERDVPTKVANRLSVRLIHRLSTPSAYLAFDIRERQSDSLIGRQVVEPMTGRRGMVGDVSVDVLRTRSSPVVAPSPVRVLGDRVERSHLFESGIEPTERSVGVPFGLDDDLAPAMVALDSMRPVLVLGQPGSGRSTAIRTLLDGAQRATDRDKPDPVVIDNAERVPQAEGEAQAARALELGLPLIVAATPSSARGFGSWIAPLLDSATVVLLNPSRADGEVCRIVVPDLRDAPTGRAVVIDRGRTSIVQIAA